MSGADESLDMVARWMEIAENDLRNATHTLTLQEDCPFDTVCFHAQQCVEKRLKAILLRFGLDVPRTHDLRVIFQMVTASSGLDIDLGEILPLNRYSVEARYPDD
jgi:HEPN domain-containing protein